MKRLIIFDLRERLKISAKRACKTLKMNRSSSYYDACPRDVRAERMKIKQIAADRPIQVLMKRDGWRINHKKIRLICLEEKLILKIEKSRRRKIPAFARVALEKAEYINHI